MSRIYVRLVREKLQPTCIDSFLEGLFVNETPVKNPPQYYDKFADS